MKNRYQYLKTAKQVVFFRLGIEFPDFKEEYFREENSVVLSGKPVFLLVKVKKAVLL